MTQIPRTRTLGLIHLKNLKSINDLLVIFRALELSGFIFTSAKVKSSHSFWSNDDALAAIAMAHSNKSPSLSVIFFLLLLFNF
jgi:hypothetical protein